jgi:alpha-D-ribose 1-methylphosphonate 5-triphosphate synthase subunit PhnH
MPPLDAFDWGSDEVPEAGATLVVQAAALAGDAGWVLRGPGIPAQARLSVAGMAGGWTAQRRTMQAAFPRGIDVVLACGERLAALPRTTLLEA